MKIEIEDWLNGNKAVQSSYVYWNDIKIEEGKIFNYIEQLETDKHLNNIYNQIIEIEKKHSIDINNKKILSLGCGTCWLEARWLKNKNPKKLIAVDFSKHRVHDLAIKTLKHFNDNYYVKLVRGDVTDIKIKNEKFDLILMINSFHNISKPVKLIEEIRRLSNYKTQIIIIGEPFHSSLEYLTRYTKYCIKWLINYKNFRSDNTFPPSQKILFKKNTTIGDTHYTKQEYNNWFYTNGSLYMKNYIDRKNGIQSFFLRYR